MYPLFGKIRRPVKAFTFFLIDPVPAELDLIKDGDAVQLNYSRSEDRIEICREGALPGEGKIGYVPRKHQKRLLRALKKNQDVDVSVKQTYDGDKVKMTCTIQSKTPAGASHQAS